MAATKEEQRKFSELISNLATDKRIGFMDAVLLHCQETGFEVELAASLLTPPIKAKISEEAQAMNMIKKINRLPL